MSDGKTRVIAASAPVKDITDAALADAVARSVAGNMNMLLGAQSLQRVQDINQEDFDKHNPEGHYILITFETVARTHVQAMMDEHKPAHEHLQETPVDGH